MQVKDTHVKKLIIINRRYTSITIEMSQDTAASIPILDIVFIIQAVNDIFRSEPLQIDMSKENINIIGPLRFIDIHLKNGDFVYNLTNLEIIFGDNKKIFINSELDMVDELGRAAIELSHISSIGELLVIRIPIDIFSTFIETLLRILEDKKIVEEVSNDELIKDEEDIKE